MRKTTILSEAPRRRRFTDEMKSTILAEMSDPEVTVAELARRYEISQALLYNWRRAAAKQSSFVQIVANEAPSLQFQNVRSFPLARVSSPSGVVIEFASPISIDDIVYLAQRLRGRA